MPPARLVARRVAWWGVALLAGLLVTLVVLHLWYADLRRGGIRWFHLGDDQNVPTWFATVLFFLITASSLSACTWERQQDRVNPRCFRFPVLWWGVALLGLWLSLDKMTAVHDHAAVREVRRLTAPLGEFWRTHSGAWQILFGPLIILAVFFLVVFFLNRYRLSVGPRRLALAGIACWIAALLLDGVSGPMRELGEGWRAIQVVGEETLEMLGALCVVASIVFYTIDIALDLDPQRREQILQDRRFLTRRAIAVLGIAALLLGAAAAGTLWAAR